MSAPAFVLVKTGIYFEYFQENNIVEVWSISIRHKMFLNEKKLLSYVPTRHADFTKRRINFSPTSQINVNYMEILYKGEGKYLLNNLFGSCSISY